MKFLFCEYGTNAILGGVGVGGIIGVVLPPSVELGVGVGIGGQLLLIYCPKCSM